MCVHVYTYTYECAYACAAYHNYFTITIKNSIAAERPAVMGKGQL